MPSQVSSCLITFDQYSDYVPVWSAITNLIGIVTKLIFEQIACACADQSAFIRHLKRKPITQSLLCTIPLVNIFVALKRDRPKLIADLEKKLLSLHPDYPKHNRNMEKLREQGQLNEQTIERNLKWFEETQAQLENTVRQMNEQNEEDMKKLNQSTENYKASVAQKKDEIEKIKQKRREIQNRKATVINDG